jgi:MscS family membrane protein
MSLTEWIPEPLLSLGPWDLAWWQWIAIVVLALLANLLARVARWLFTWGVKRVVKHTDTTLDDELLDRLASPLRLLGTLLFFRVGMPWLELDADHTETITDVLLVIMAFGIVWGVLRMIEVVISHVSRAAWVATRPTSRSLLSLVGRILKVVVVVIAAITALGAMGLPIASLLAGLGIGGIALAFGAQKTVENLFGAIALGVDQPLREGDFVKVEDNVLGTVEAIGLRSTRVRTLDRTMVTLPNGRLSEMRIETFAARDRCRLFATIGVVYDTSAAQLRAVLEGFEQTLRSHPQVWTENVAVRFIGFGASSLDIEVMSWFTTPSWDEFKVIRQQVLIGFMEVVEKAGTAFAYPTQTIHVASLPKAA